MQLKDLKEKVENIIENLRDNGICPNENNFLDYKCKLNNIDETRDPKEIFLINFCKDIISFSNSDGGIILIGFKEDKDTGKINDLGLDEDNLNILQQIDLNLITQQFENMTNVGVGIDLQRFNIGTREYYYLLIEKQSQILVPKNNFHEYKLNKGDIYYRASSKNEHANKSTTDFNRFLQIKANEKNKEFMDIWSKLLPEMFDINPREVLILNPKSNRIYGYNAKDNILSSSNIDIDQDEVGVFNIILNAISAGDIGKISNDEGKPLYKIIGELTLAQKRNFIYLSDISKEVKEKVNFNFTDEQLKLVFFFLKWTNIKKLSIEKPNPDNINATYNNFIWIETLGKKNRVVFSEDAIFPIVNTINDKTKHLKIFGKELNNKKIINL
jgi:hypothetical protein